MPNAAPSAALLLSLCSASDDLLLAADQEAELQAAWQVSCLLSSDLVTSAAALLAAAAHGLGEGRAVWHLLDGADRAVSDLRMEHGCEDWATADWSQAEVAIVAQLHATLLEQRQEARRQRDAALAVRLAG